MTSRRSAARQPKTAGGLSESPVSVASASGSVYAAMTEQAQNASGRSVATRHRRCLDDVGTERLRCAA